MSGQPGASGYERCGAKTRSGKPCGLPAGHGTEHVGYGRCRRHGGNTPTHVAAAHRDQAEDLVVTYGLPVEADPQEALLDELHRCVGHVAWLAAKVGGLETEHLTAEVGGSEHGEPRVEPSVWVRMYQAERAQLAKVARSCIDVGIEERKVRLTEQAGELIGAMIFGVLKDLGVLDHPEAENVVRRHLAALEAGQRTTAAA